MSDVATKPKLTIEQTRRRTLTSLSFNDIGTAVHVAGVATGMLAAIREVCVKAEAEKWALNPAGLIQWIDEHDAQLNPATAVAVDPPVEA